MGCAGELAMLAEADDWLSETVRAATVKATHTPTTCLRLGPSKFHLPEMLSARTALAAHMVAEAERQQQ